MIIIRLEYIFNKFKICYFFSQSNVYTYQFMCMIFFTLIIYIIDIKNIIFTLVIRMINIKNHYHHRKFGFI